MKNLNIRLLLPLIFAPLIVLANPIAVGIDYSYPETWVIGTLMIVPGLIIETLVSLIFLSITGKAKKIALYVLMINMISMPISWYLLSVKIPFFGNVVDAASLVTASWLGVLVYETVIVILETILIKLAVKKALLFSEALRMSFFCNLASFLTGIAVIYVILMILRVPPIIN